MQRDELVTRLGERILAMAGDGPVRVGIDGVGAAGKTVLADELAVALRPHRPVIRANVDGFHHPPVVRYRRGRNSIEGYYHDSFDYPSMRRVLLNPLAPGGSRRIITAAYDFRCEAAVEETPHRAAEDSILIFEGVFLFRPELIDCWDLRVFVHAPFTRTVERACVRDRNLYGDPEAIRCRYVERYIPGQQHYLDLVDPVALADIVVDNTDYDAPKLTRCDPDLAPSRW